ncbi:B3/4 domain-containing protein [Jiangella asiatica]|uniref:B3/B4 tRNA-binding domain-containing protein n=1 Tax=Jiangella asiatica TaxID=2530372 RepID=A0A4R5DKV8_9ACTN|nr:phenylalanine--tRNA ligase beta subunit-related protein [Jiangella asiatica]TDE11475.1 hypothetical protein E1269_09415 [Jiangella asiatica]
MRFRHAPELRAAHPGLAAGVVAADGVGLEAVADRRGIDERFAADQHAALERLAVDGPGQQPEIQAWRRAFAAMGLKPTQYRCAAESLLRRLAKAGDLPRIHPLVDLCNAASAAAAIPVAVIDRDRVVGDLEVRYARGDEEYATFVGEIEHPAAGEVIFADDAGRAHARRWTHKQSGWSTVRPSTSRVLIVAEALHDGAGDDVSALVARLAGDIERFWPAAPHRAVLTSQRPELQVDDPATTTRAR